MRRERIEVLSDYSCLNLVEDCVDLIASAGLDSDMRLKGVKYWARDVLCRLHPT